MTTYPAPAVVKPGFNIFSSGGMKAFTKK